MNKIDEMHKMLWLLVNRRPHPPFNIHEISKGVFRIDRLFSIDLSEQEMRDDYQFTIDFNKRKFTLYAYNESCHSGDHYSCYTKKIEWDLILSGYEQIKRLLRKYVEADLEQEIKDKRNAAILSKIQWLLK